MSKNKPKTGLKNGLESGPGKPGTGLRLPAGRAQTHGGYSYLTTGKLPENRREIQRYLTQVREGLIADFGPTENDLSTSQVILVNSIATSTGFLRLVEEHCRETGAFGPDGELRHCLSAFYLSMLNSQRLNILALKNIGRCERPADKVIDLAEYIRQADAAKSEKDKANGLESPEDRSS